MWELFFMQISKLGLSEAIKKLVGVVIDEKVRPILETSNIKEEDRNNIEQCLMEYLATSHNKAITMNTIVFRGYPKKLYDLYVPITLTANMFGDRSREEYVMNENYDTLLKRYNKILIVDTAGMGKSTLVKYLAVQSINNNTSIPIIVELRKLEKHEDILDYILRQFDSIDKKITKEHFIPMLKRGDFTIFFDGYDEVSVEKRGIIIDNLKDFIYKASDNKFVLTSREESDLSALGEFIRFSIKPLKISEAYELIKRYDEEGTISESLINRLQEDSRMKVVRDFLKNPLLVSLLYKTYEYKEDIAYKKLSFYEQVYEALFYDHDKTKGGAYVHDKKSGLDAHSFERLLRRIAFFSLQENKVGYSKNEIYEFIDKSIKGMSSLNLVTSESVLDDLLHAVPLMHKDGNDIKWVHKSFMEYFAASFICYDSGEIDKLFRHMMKSKGVERYTNVLGFCYEINPDVFRRVIILPFLKKYIDFYDKVFWDIKQRNWDKKLICKIVSLEFCHSFRLGIYDSVEAATAAFNDKHSILNKMFMPVKGVNIRMLTHVGNILIGQGDKNECFLSNVLYDNGIDIFLRVPTKISHDLYFALEGMERKIYVWDNILNQTEENVSTIIQSVLPCITEKYFIDYEKCVQLKAEIEDEMMIAKSLSFDLF